MRLLIQRSLDPVPYRGAYFRISADAEHPTRGSVVLAPPAEWGDDASALALLLGLALALGKPAGAGGAPIRQYWLSPDLQLEGKMGSEASPRIAAEVHRLGARVEKEWDRFLGNVFARLRGHTRGDQHLAYADAGWDADQPAVRVTAWPPLTGETLPPLQ